MTRKNESRGTDSDRVLVHPLRRLAIILLPSSFLLPVLLLYLNADGTAHFFLHTLMGWNIGLVLLSVSLSCGRSRSRWDGFLPLGVSFYALVPDFIYRFGPFHRDWMDLFLFHVSLDETLVPALPVLAILWMMLLIGYIRVPNTRSPFVDKDVPKHTGTLPFPGYNTNSQSVVKEKADEITRNREDLLRARGVSGSELAMN